jgi:hypothetical protein
MIIWLIPMKGKGWETTARNIAVSKPLEEARPLTTDPFDNMILTYEKQEVRGYA